ncbi:cellulose binding domain-containing protein [Micromonospora sp. NPDC048894]|uniref:cellulose binding domain-containing protein n=1 Tax=unclassified Micromonospora TaxID=2617518 RepID=UPI001C5FE81D|nr:cellulose binding domain-containing protein [Micromonospora sp. RL09-050-HVF-A]
MAAGATISQLWNGTLSTSGSSVTVRNAAHNGSLAANASTTFGFLVNGAPATPPLTVTTP